MSSPSEQRHPQHHRDLEIVNQIAQESRQQPLKTMHLVETARLRIRYKGFPGAYDIQRTLDAILEAWNLTEDELFHRTRALHQTTSVYEGSFSKRDDWA